MMPATAMASQMVFKTTFHSSFSVFIRVCPSNALSYGAVGCSTVGCINVMQ